jgi:hypothetical protein
MNTGNPIVDVVGTLDCAGLSVPPIWFYTITRESGQPHYPAIALLAELVAWYTPKPVYNEKGYIVDYRPQFEGEFLCRSYEKFCESLNMSKKQVQRALAYLEDSGIIQKHFYEEYIPEYRTSIQNQLAIELIPEGLIAVSGM